MDEGLNHSGIINMVLEGFGAALVEHDPAEQVNNTKETDNLCAQLHKMRELIKKMNSAQQNQQNVQ